jgi:hypothetical protein
LVYRAALVLPAGWLAFELRQTFNTLLKLKHHYEYKATVAGSVEGFKSQIAPENTVLQEQMVKQAYDVLLNLNPAEFLDKRAKLKEVKAEQDSSLAGFFTEKLTNMLNAAKEQINSLTEMVSKIQGALESKPSGG